MLRIKEGAKGCSEPVKGKPGTYRIFFSLGRDPESGKNGKRVRYLKTPKRTIHCKSKNPKNWPGEIARHLDDYRDELNGLTAPRNTLGTVGSYADEFHRMREDAFGSPLSFEREGDYVKHIKELFGDIPLRALKPDDIRAAYAASLKSGRFSDSEIYSTHKKLRQIMESALDNELIDRNPCKPVKVPAPKREPRRFLEPEELPHFTECILSEKMGPMTVCTMLCFHLGLRKGEALGLSWEDYDAAGGTVTIRRQWTTDRTLRPPKSETSRRTITVDASLAEYLAEWRTRQLKTLGKLGIDQGPDTPIVHSISKKIAATGTVGSISRPDPRNYNRWLRSFAVRHGYASYEEEMRYVDKKGKERIRRRKYSGELVPHGLRHTNATALVASGMDVKTVQRRLGHSSVDVTLSIYAHAVEANDRKAAVMFDRMSASTN